MGAARDEDTVAGVSHPRTPVEYFRQDERGSRFEPFSSARAACNPPRRRARPSDGTQGAWRGFTLGGHRLSSLYRVHHASGSGLRDPYLKTSWSSSWSKYSNTAPATGAASGGMCL